MKDEFKLLVSIKKLNLYVLDVVKMFPNKERILKDNLVSECFNSIKNVYFANDLDINDELRRRYYHVVLVNIYMIDYYIFIGYHYKYICEKDYNKINNLLREVSKMAKGWINYGKSNG